MQTQIELSVLLPKRHCLFCAVSFRRSLCRTTVAMRDETSVQSPTGAFDGYS